MINFTLKTRFIKSKNVWGFQIDNNSTQQCDIQLANDIQDKLFKIFQHLILHQTVSEENKHLFVVLTNPEAPICIDELLTINNLN